MARPRSSTTALRKTLDQSRRPVYVLDEGRVIIYCNQACAEWTGLAIDDLIALLDTDIADKGVGCIDERHGGSGVQPQFVSDYHVGASCLGVRIHCYISGFIGASANSIGPRYPWSCCESAS